jgi:hypothetical protein
LDDCDPIEDLAGYINLGKSTVNYSILDILGKEDIDAPAYPLFSRWKRCHIAGNLCAIRSWVILANSPCYVLYSNRSSFLFTNFQHGIIGTLAQISVGYFGLMFINVIQPVSTLNP